MSPERTPSAQDQIARNGIVSEVPGFSPIIESAAPVDSTEKQEADSGRVLSVGDRVSVLRNPREGSTSTDKWLDRSDWRVIKTNPEVTTAQKATTAGEETETKTFNTTELTALQERLDEELRRQIGEEAVEQSVEPVDNSVDSEELSPEAQTEEARLEKAIDDLMDSVPEADRVGVWQYGTALYEPEMARAKDKMSRATIESGAHTKYADLYAQYKKVRSV